jgi:hypothetical protein
MTGINSPTSRSLGLIDITVFFGWFDRKLQDEFFLLFDLIFRPV